MQKLLLVVALLGLLVSGYLLVAYASAGPILCVGGHGCDTVRASKWSALLGIPTPLYGIIYYLLLGIGAALWAPANWEKLRVPLFLLTGVGLAVSGWLSYLEAFVVGAWCAWCVASALLATVAFVITWFGSMRRVLP